MKKIKLLGFLLLTVMSLLFIQCTSDNMVAVGPAGADGADGVDGVDGVDGSAASCISCHSETHTAPINAAYLSAKHATGGSWVRGTIASCAKCHNNEGFIDFISGNYVDDEGRRSVNPAGYSVSNPLTCTGCHDTHRSFDFENDGNDFAVRTLDEVPLYFLEGSGFDYTIDYGNASNTCANCHQPRRGAPQPNLNGKFLQTSTHWGPHHGPQTALLEGIQGAYSTFTTLVEAIPPAKEAAHRTGSSCIECHMGATTDGSFGHSWVPAKNNCATCHPGTVPTEVAGLGADMTTLAALLEDVVGQAIAKDANGDWQPVFEADGVTPVPVVGIVHDDHPVVGLYNLKDAEAAWNYLFVLEDKSEGLHNPDYAKAIIKNSIAAMQ